MYTHTHTHTHAHTRTTHHTHAHTAHARIHTHSTFKSCFTACFTRHSFILSTIDAAESRADTEQLQHLQQLHLHDMEAQETQHAHTVSPPSTEAYAHPWQWSHAQRKPFDQKWPQRVSQAAGRGGHWSPRQPLVVNLSKVQIVVIANTTCCAGGS